MSEQNPPDEWPEVPDLIAIPPAARPPYSSGTEATMKPTNPKQACGVIVVAAGGDRYSGYACIRKRGHLGCHVALCVQPGVRR